MLQRFGRGNCQRGRCFRPFRVKHSGAVQPEFAGPRLLQESLEVVLRLLLVPFISTRLFIAINRKRRTFLVRPTYTANLASRPDSQ